MEIFQLSILMPFGGAGELIHPVVLRGGGACILVDCGFVGSLPLIECELNAHGVDPGDVTAVVLTHHDHDHMGAAAAFKAKYPQVIIAASEPEAPYICAKTKPLRLLQAEQLQAQLPPDKQAFGAAFCAMLRGITPVEVDLLLHDGDELFHSGVRVIATPGHTPGHISLYHPASGTLIAGDAIALEQGKPVLANPQFTLDVAAASASLQTLLSMGAETLLCYHGGRYSAQAI